MVLSMPQPLLPSTPLNREEKWLLHLELVEQIVYLSSSLSFSVLYYGYASVNIIIPIVVAKLRPVSALLIMMALVFPTLLPKSL
ncbi:hypothetical protein ACB092_01G418200 [Castanea dentata]